MRGSIVALAVAFASLMLFSGAGATDARMESPSQTSVEVDQSHLSPVDDTSLFLCDDGSFIVTNKTSSQSVKTGLNYTLSSFAWRPDGSYALIVGQGGTFIKYSLKFGMILIESGTGEDLTSVSWKPDGSFALITGCHGMIIRFDHDTQRCLRIQTNTDLKLKDVQWDTSGEHASITGEDNTTIMYPPEAPAIPAILITGPAAGSAVAGEFTVAGTASVEYGSIIRVEARMDSGGWLPASGTGSWAICLDARPYDNGLHTVHARAWSSEYEVTQTSVEIRIENIKLPPLVEILTPPDCGHVFGIVTIEGTAASFSGAVERVDVRVDDFDWGRAVGTGFWRLSLDTTTLPNGIHRVQARVWDGAQFSAASRLMIIENGAPEPAVRPSNPVPAPGECLVSVPKPAEPKESSTSTTATLPATTTGVPVNAPVAAPVRDGGTIVVPAVSWGMLLITALALGTEPGKYAFLQFFFVPLYSRIKKDAVLDNFTRGMIYGFIMSNPGVHYNFIKQKLGLNNGSIVYHLTVLERQELIKSEKVGLYKRFYPMGQTLSETGIMELNEVQQSMLELVRENPGLTQRELGERLNLSSRVVNYHIGLLQRGRLVTLEKDGKVTRCFATERMPVC